MERIMNQFREHDLNVLLLKKRIVIEEMQKNKEYEEKLSGMLKKIDKAIQDVKVTTYEYDSD
jgi:hypothetical protein